MPKTKTTRYEEPREQNEPLGAIVPIYKIQKQGRKIRATPIDDDTPVLIADDEGMWFVALREARKMAEEQGRQLFLSYFDGRKYWYKGVPGYDDFIADLEASLSIVDEVETVEVFKVEHVRDWWFTFRVAGWTILGTYLLTHISIIVAKILGG